MAALDEVLAALDIRPVDGGRFVADSVREGAGAVVFGGQLLGQSIVAASRVVPDKQVLSLQTVFLRGASLDEELVLEVETLHSGRAFSTVGVSVRQGDRTCVRSTALLHAPDADLIRHQVDAPDVQGPDGLAAVGHTDWWEVRVVGDVDLQDPEAVGPAELQVWSRVPGAPSDATVNQALLAYATDGFLIGTAMRPHPGVGQALAHVSVSTTVLAHNLTFHERIDAGSWLLLDQRSTAAGHGRAHGLGEIFTQEGQLVASFSQESMVRAMPAGQGADPGAKAKY